MYGNVTGRVNKKVWKKIPISINLKFSKRPKNVRKIKIKKKSKKLV